MTKTKPYKPHIYYNPCSNSIRGENHVRWIEHAGRGLRWVGFADQIINIRHTGWFADDNQDEIFRGVVYQLPTRHGEQRFAYGYADPNNKNCALLSFDPCDCKEDAARWADQFAEHCAEDSREAIAAEELELAS